VNVTAAVFGCWWTRNFCRSTQGVQLSCPAILHGSNRSNWKCPRWRQNSVHRRRRKSGKQRLDTRLTKTHRDSRSSSLPPPPCHHHRSYAVLDCRRSSLSGRRCSCLERAATPRHVITVNASLRSVVWKTGLFNCTHFPTFCIVPAMWLVIIGHALLLTWRSVIGWPGAAVRSRRWQRKLKAYRQLRARLSVVGIVP